MPTYEYKCEACGYIFEKFQSIKEEPIKVCPECNARVKRLIGTGAGFIFKGTGFYATDYRSEGYKKKQKDEQPLKSKESKESAKVDSKSSIDKVTTPDKKSRDEK